MLAGGTSPLSHSSFIPLSHFPFRQIKDSPMTKWVAYTDGACAPSNPGPAAWGAVVIAPDGGEVAAHSGYIGHGTNQIAEITAAIKGLSRTPEGAAVELVSDSQYVLKGITEWRAGWERKGYRNSKGEPVANLALWKRLFALADKRRVTTRWVRGHNGDFHNEQADQLATAALRTARSAGAAPAGGTAGDYTRPLE
jgi:ribonuclease HI